LWNFNYEINKDMIKVCEMCYTTIGEGYKSYFLNHIVLREQNEFEKQSRSKE